MPEGDLIKTGIQGLDSILLGGIPRGNVILAQGVTGSGKTLMGLEFIYQGIVQYNEPGLVVVFETSPDKLIRDAAGFGWNLDELQQQKKLQIVFTTPQVLDQELRSPDSLLLEAATEMGAIVYPPVPAFYAKPDSLEDMVDHTVGRALDLFDIDVGVVDRWGEQPELRGRPAGPEDVA